MIDLSDALGIIDEMRILAADLDGEELDESKAIGSQAKGRPRQELAAMSRNLSFLADRLEFAAALVRSEYWISRGKTDPLDAKRREAPRDMFDPEA